MFEWGWVDELDGNTAADELARSTQLVVAAEAGQFLLAAHWADLHAAEFVAEWTSTLPGMPRLVPAGPEGCPEIDEFAGAELAVLTGMTTRAGEGLIRDAVTVRHRHPLLWDRLKAGQVRVWVARKVAQRCAAAGLDPEMAKWVDEETTPYATTLPMGRFFDLVEAKIIEVDPIAAENRDRDRARARFVHAGPRDEAGMRTLVARASAGDITYVVAVIERIAEILAEQGSTEPADARRATALRILANPARALALLLGETLSETAEDATDLAADQYARGESGLMLDGSGDDFPDSTVLGEVTPETVLPEEFALLSGAPLAGGGSAPSEAGVEEGLDPALLVTVLEALAGFDASALDPVTVVHVHIAEERLANRHGAVRTEEHGPWTVRMLREWLSHPECPDWVTSRINVRPVLDARTVIPVDRYEIPARMGELVTARQPFEVFPYGTGSARRADKDHIEPWTPSAEGGQTSSDNLAPLTRRHHRIKTHGGWVLHRDHDDGAYWWRTRHGHWLRVDHHGTHHHGRDPALDARWSTSNAAA